MASIVFTYKVSGKIFYFSLSKVCSEHMNDWQYLLLGVRRTKWILPQKEILRFSCALTFTYGHVTCHVTKTWNEENWWIGGEFTLIG